MRKLLFMFLILLALPTVAQELEQTEAPSISWSSNSRWLYIRVTGMGELTVEVLMDGELVARATCQSDYEYVYELDEMGEHQFEIFATAQEPGMAVSEVAYETYIAPAKVILPPPDIAYVEYADGISITLCAVVQLHIAIYINGELMTNYPPTPESSFTYWVERSYDEDKDILITAYDSTPEGITSETATFEYCLERMPRPIAPTPTVTILEFEEGAVIEAAGEGEIHLFVNDDAVEIPWYVERTNVDQTLVVRAYATMPDYDPSDVYEKTFVLTALPPVPEPEITSSPTMSYEYFPGSACVIVHIEPTEPSQLYYYIGYDVGVDEYGWTSWEYSEPGEYYDPVMITEPGHYCVVAYAIADGKEQSSEMTIEFVISPPLPQVLYDFEENGIYYSITSEDKVSVCAETTEYNSYSGEVVIPSTVTHGGVTYRVTAIDEYAFCQSTGLTRVTIGDLVTKIGNGAFANCYSLTTLTLPDYVITVGYEAFAYCRSLTSLTLGYGLSNISSSAFYGCNALTTVTSKAATPPTMGSSSSFTCYNQATLRVHPAVIDSYRSANNWNRFQNIVGENSVAPMPGDADGDGRLSARDVATLINMLLNAK